MSLYNGGSGTYLRSCLTDYKLAMDHPHETGFYCYRAIESVRKHFQGENQSDKEGWKVMRGRLDISKDDLMYVKGFASERRHGGISDISGEDRSRVLSITWDVIMNFVDFLDS